MKKSVLAVQFDDYNLRIAEGYTTPKKWIISKYVVEDIGGKSDEDIATAFKDALKKTKIKSKNTVLILPRNLVTVRYLQLPTNDVKELRNMIDMQVERQIPYTKEEMVYDYYIMGIAEDGSSKVLLVIAHKDLVSRYAKICEKAGIKVNSIELDSFGVLKVCSFLRTSNVELFSGDQPIAVLDVDNSVTNIEIIQNGVLIFTRAVSIGSMQIYNKMSMTSGKDWMNEWIGEINRSLTVFQKEQTIPIKKIVLFDNKKIVSIAKDRLGIPVEEFDLSPYIEGAIIEVLKGKLGSETDGGVQPGISNKETEDVIASSISLLGVVREGIDTSVNLIPLEVKKHVIAAERKASMFITVFLLAGILSVFGFTMHKKIQDRKDYLAFLEKRLDETGPASKDLGVKKDRLALIKKQLSVEGTSLDVLRELYTIIPQKTALNIFVYDETQGVSIRGVSPAMSEVFELVPKLENSPYFDKVTPRSTTQKKVRGQELTDFQIDWIVAVQQKS